MSFGRRFLQQFRKLLSCIGLLLLLHTATRIFLWSYNRSLFPAPSFGEGYNIFRLGLQQDFVSLVFLNSPVIVWVMIADLMPDRERLYRVAKWLFLFLNIPGLAVNCIDIGYFRFSKHRSNLDLWYVFWDSLGSFRSILSGYWPVILYFVAGVFILFRIARILDRQPPAVPPPTTLQILLNQFLFIAILLLPCGVLSGSPVLPGTPLLFLSPSDLPVAQNSILTAAWSVLHRHRTLEPLNYFSKQELDGLVKTVHVMGGNQAAGARGMIGITPDTMQRKNVVIFILESFSRCYIMPGDPQKANTPFFDSLIRKSLFFPNSFANGFTSNQGIVSILGGLPGLMEEPFYYSDYANTPLKSIGNILKAAGYETDFFMGAGKDHFGFGKFSHMAGIDHYYSRDDFNSDQRDGDRFYDGNWGIFDEPFLQFGAKVLSDKQQPFMATFFTISSHPPYTIPGALRDRFAVPGKTPAQRSISYTDYSFQRFFETCRNAPWFANTLFVFCADHWLYPDDHTSYTPVNSSTIPIFIYDPSKTEGRTRHSLASQVDLAPTVLDMLHYKGVYTGFGRSLLDSGIADSDRYAINQLGYNYQVINDEFVLGYDLTHDSSRYLYRYKTDSLLKKDLLRDKDYAATRKRLETWIRANLQAYNHALLQRSLE